MQYICRYKQLENISINNIALKHIVMLRAIWHIQHQQKSETGIIIQEHVA